MLVPQRTKACPLLRQQYKVALAFIILKGRVMHVRTTYTAWSRTASYTKPPRNIISFSL